MSYADLTWMRASLKSQLLRGIDQSGTQRFPDAIKSVEDKMAAIDLKTAERFLKWSCDHNITLSSNTIDVRWHEYRKHSGPVSEKEAVEIWEAFNPNTAPETLLRIVLRGPGELHVLVARNSSAPSDLLSLLAADIDLQVRNRIAGRVDAPPDVLVRLARDPDEVVRETVADNPSTPWNALSLLAGDSSAWIRLSVAAHVSTAPDTLARLAMDRDKNVRTKVGGNLSTPPDVLNALAGDSEPIVRAYVAKNPFCPHETLSRLAQDTNEAIREYAAMNPGPPPPLPKSGLELLQNFQRAKSALMSWLEEQFPRNKRIDNDCVHGIILETHIDEDGNPTIEVEADSRRLVTIKPLEFSGKADSANSPDRPKGS